MGATPILPPQVVDSAPPPAPDSGATPPPATAIRRRRPSPTSHTPPHPVSTGRVPIGPGPHVRTTEPRPTGKAAPTPALDPRDRRTPPVRRGAHRPTRRPVRRILRRRRLLAPWLPAHAVRHACCGPQPPAVHPRPVWLPPQARTRLVMNGPTGRRPPRAQPTTPPRAHSRARARPPRRGMRQTAAAPRQVAAPPADRPTPGTPDRRLDGTRANGAQPRNAPGGATGTGIGRGPKRDVRMPTNRHGPDATPPASARPSPASSAGPL